MTFWFLFGLLCGLFPIVMGALMAPALLFCLLGMHSVGPTRLSSSRFLPTTPAEHIAAERHIQQIKQIDPNDPTRGIIAALIVAAGIAVTIAAGHYL